jgi:signal transduction histidine kinase
MLVRMDDGQLQQVITNLFLNAVQAMPGGGEVQVALEEAGDAVRLTVADQGQGIAAEALPRIFDPFFTTKGVGEGTGLGLSVAYGIVKEHGGWIDVESLPGRGTRFFVHLPRTEAA